MSVNWLRHLFSGKTVSAENDETPDFMSHIIKPTKEAIRAWMKQRRSHVEPLPDREHIRRALGWMLVTHPGQNRSSR